MAGLTVRDAVEADLVGIVAIYNDVVARSTAIWSEAPTSLDERQAWLAQRRANGYPVLVAVEAGVVGFASFGPFRPWPGYAATVEHSVHVRVDRRGSGVGRALLEELIASAKTAGAHAMVGGIDAANEGSLRFHAGLGFAEVGRLPQVGRKFGRWLDLVFVEKLLERNRVDS